MQEVFEKIISQIDNERNSIKKSNVIYTMGEYEGLTVAKEIVKQAAEEYDNGWIPCSERMPEERDSMFARLKGTDKWDEHMFEKTSKEVNVTISNEKGDRATTHAHTTDGKWRCDALKFNTTNQVIAWQPFPDPYQPEGE